MMPAAMSTRMTACMTAARMSASVRMPSAESFTATEAFAPAETLWRMSARASLEAAREACRTPAVEALLRTSATEQVKACGVRLAGRPCEGC